MNWVGGFSFCLFIGLLLAASLKKLKQRGKKKKEQGTNGKRGEKRKIQAAKRRLQIQKAEHPVLPSISIIGIPINKTL